LAENHSEKFDELYLKYEAIPGKARKVLKAREVWKAVLDMQTETGTPYMLFKDACNAKSNQQNLGTIRCSNLCTEIIEYTSPEEIAVYVAHTRTHAHTRITTPEREYHDE
jgi:ribonucleotide reductase alpha subunit